MVLYPSATLPCTLHTFRCSSCMLPCSGLILSQEPLALPLDWMHSTFGSHLMGHVIKSIGSRSHSCQGC